MNNNHQQLITGIFVFFISFLFIANSHAETYAEMKRTDGISLVQSDSQKIVLQYKSSDDKGGNIGTKVVELVLYPSPENKPQITEYTYRVKNPDGTMKEVHSTDAGAPSLSDSDIKALVGLSTFGYIRDYQTGRCSITVSRTFTLPDKTTEERKFTYLKIEISNPNSKDILHSPLRKKGIGLENALGNILLNYDSADDLRGKPILSFGNEPDQYPGLASNDFYQTGKHWIKLSVNQTGIFKVTYSDITQYGYSLDGVDPQTFRIYSQGTEIPISIIGQNGNSFSPNNAIVFYAEPIINIYTHTGNYWLTWGGKIGKRIFQDTNPVDKTLPTFRRFQETLHLEENHMYEDYVSPPQKDNWFWQTIEGGDTLKLDIPVNGLSSQDSMNYGDMPVRLRIHLYGKTDTGSQDSHKIEIKFNGTALGEKTWSGRSFAEFNTTVPNDILNEEINHISISLSKNTVGPLDEIYLDYLEMDYPREIKLGKGTQEITGQRIVSDAKLNRIYIRNNENKNLIPVVVGIDSERNITQPFIIPEESSYNESNYDYSFQLTNGNQYFVGDLAGLESPLKKQEEGVQDLRDTTQQADVIYITHPDFMSAVKTLADWRSKQGLVTKIVNIYDIYNQFNFGNFDPRAIQYFLQYCFYYWKSPSPNYVVLVGDANWDYMDYQQTGSRVFIPSYRSPFEPILNTDNGSNEDYYVHLCGQDNYPDLVLGRLSVRTPEDAMIAVQKTIAQETISELGTWRTKSVIAVDDGFESDGFEAKQNYLPLWMTPDYVFQQDYIYIDHQKFGKASRRKQTPQGTQALVDRMNEGSPFLLYIGHGGGGVWSHERLFLGGSEVRSSDTYRIHNLNRNLFVYTMSCLNGFFDYPNAPWESILAEQMIQDPGKGAIAMLVPTGKGGTGQHLDLGRGMSDAFFRNNVRTIGDAVYQGKIKYLFNTSDFGLVQQYTILGDPLAQNALPKKSIVLHTTPSFIQQGKENTFKITGTPENGLEEGFVTVGLYTAESSKPLVEKSKVKFTRGRFEINLPLPKTYVPLILRAYAWNDNTRMDGAGGIAIPLQNPSLEFLTGVKENENNTLSLKIKNKLSDSLDSYSLKVDITNMENKKQSFNQNIKESLSPNQEKEIIIPIKNGLGVNEVHITLDGTIGPDHIAISTTDVISIPANSNIDKSLGMVPMDLTMTPQDVSNGDTITLQAVLHNYGNSTLTNIPYEWLINKTPVGTSSIVSSINPMGSTNLQCTWTVPSTYLSGSQESKDIDVQVKVDGQILQEKGLPIHQIPDLVIANRDIKTSPERFVEGQTIFFDFLVHNEGGLPARNIYITGFDGDPAKGGIEMGNIAMVSAKNIDILNPGESKSIRLRWDPPINSYGKHTMYLYVDKNQVNRDLERNNQVVIFPLTLYKNADLSVKKEDITWTPAQPYAGETILVTAIIHNIGETDAQTAYPWGPDHSYSFDVKFHVRKTDGQEYAIGPTLFIPILQAGKSIKVTRLIPITPDITSIIVKADSENEVVEMDEYENNIAEKPIEIIPLK